MADHQRFIKRVVRWLSLRTFKQGVPQQASMPSPLQITRHSFQRMPMIRVSGDLVFGHDVGVLCDHALQLTGQGDTDVILDLREMTATDSTGLGAILEFRRSLGDGQGSVHLLQPPERLSTQLKVAHVESMFIVVDSDEHLRRLNPSLRRR